MNENVGVRDAMLVVIGAIGLAFACNAAAAEGTAKGTLGALN